MKLNSFDFSLSPTHTNGLETLGQALHVGALYCIRPIDYAVECSIRAFTTTLKPNRFGNQSSVPIEILLRIMSVFAHVLFLPLSLPLYAIGTLIDQIGDLFTRRCHDNLEGVKQKNRPQKNFTVLSANLCMLSYGIWIFAGMSSPLQRIEAVAKEIIRADADFLCLQEMAPGPAGVLWNELNKVYTHGFFRIGPMPMNRMGCGLFFASKYPVEETRFYPLPNQGPIFRGVFCAKTPFGWILNTHLSAGAEQKELRQKQVEVLQEICEELFQKDSLACLLFLDSNILRTGKEGDEYSQSPLATHFTSGLKVTVPFTLTEETATCTNIPGFETLGKAIPKDLLECFERIDEALIYTRSIQNKLKISTTIIKKDPPLSDHNFLFSKITSAS